MYSIVSLEELQIGDKVIVVFNKYPRIVTVEEVDLEDYSFTIVEGGANIYLDPIAVIEENDEDE